MPNTADTLGEQQTLDGLVGGSLKELVDDRVTSYSISIAESTSQWSSLSRLELPNLDMYYFEYAPRITHAVFKSAKYKNTFYSRGLYNLMHLALTSQSRPTTGRTTPLYDTLIDKGLGIVYVQPQYLSAFRNDADWGAYRIESIEDYPMELGTITDSWEEIVEACEDGTYASKYQVGDTKEITINNEYAIATLVAMDADVLWDDGVTTVPTTWMTIPLPTKYYRSLSTSQGDRSTWENCNLRSYMTTIFNAFPSSVRQAIKTVRKTFRYYDGTNKTGECGDKLWVPSMRELTAATASDAENYENDGPRYTLPTYSFSYPYNYWCDGVNPRSYSWTRTMNYYNASYTYYFHFSVPSGGTVYSQSTTVNTYEPITVGFCI